MSLRNPGSNPGTVGATGEFEGTDWPLRTSRISSSTL